MADAALVVPVKAFRAAKRRLSPALDPDARARLARALATRVVRSAPEAGMPVLVVCDDPEVARWATSEGVEVLWCPGTGLNGAVAAGVAHLAERAVAVAIVAHADLPFVSPLGWVARYGGVTVVPDRHGRGTNVLGVPTDAGFVFSYGPGSFTRHVAVALRLGLPVRVVPEPRLGWDVDRPADLLPPAPADAADLALLAAPPVD